MKDEKERSITSGEKILETFLGTHMKLYERIVSSTNVLLTISSVIFSVSIGFFAQRV